MVTQAKAIDPRREAGRRGEDVALAHFESQGFRLITRNWNCRFGELDLVLEKDGIWHVIEVKARRTTTYGRPEESVTQTKLRHLAAAMELFRRSHVDAPRELQMHVCAILWKPDGTYDLRVIQNVGPG